MLTYRFFFVCLILYLRAICKYKLPGAYIRRGDLTEGFGVSSFGGGGLFSEFYDSNLNFSLTLVHSPSQRKKPNKESWTWNVNATTWKLSSKECKRN